MATDRQLDALCGLIQAKLGATGCAKAYPWQLVGPPPRPGAPFLEVFRQGGTFGQGGNRGQRKNAVRVAINLYHGPQPKGSFRSAFAELAAAVEKIDEALSEGQHPDWTAEIGTPPVTTPLRLWDESDTDQEHSFGIESVVVGEYEFAYAHPGEGKREIYPCVQLVATMFGRTRNYVTDAEPLTRIDGNLTLDDVSGAVDWEETFGAAGPVGTWHPKVTGVRVIETIGAGPVVASASDRTVTVESIVPGTTTIEDIAAALAADEDVAALLEIGGTGTVGADYTGQPGQALWSFGWHIVKFRAVTT